MKPCCREKVPGDFTFFSELRLARDAPATILHPVLHPVRQRLDRPFDTGHADDPGPPGRVPLDDNLRRLLVVLLHDHLELAVLRQRPDDDARALAAASELEAPAVEVFD